MARYDYRCTSCGNVFEVEHGMTERPEVSCPTCGRTRIDLIGLATRVEEMVADIDLDVKVAVMGCVVNGPGEAREADIGIAGGCGEGLLIKKGEIVKKVKEEELLETLRQELLHWNE